MRITIQNIINKNNILNFCKGFGTIGNTSGLMRRSNIINIYKINKNNKNYE